MAKDEKDKTPEQSSTASQSHPMERSLTERDPRHGSHVVDRTNYQRHPEDHLDPAARRTSIHSVSIHSFSATEIEEDCWVYNGSNTNGQNVPGIRIHRMEGGKVKKGSKVHNGDMSVDEIRQFFCNGR